MKRLAVFASGSGTNFEAIAQACVDGRIDARIALLVCDVPGAKVLERGERFGVETFCFRPKSYACKADFESEIADRMDALGIDLVCLAGLERYGGRIINIHPSLLPAFKGAHAVEDAVAYGVKVYGITIHWVDATLDGGRIIAQEAFPYDGCDPAEVHRIGQKIEHRLYIETIQKLLQA